MSKIKPNKIVSQLPAFSLSGIILAGGKSSRLKNKCFLKLDKKSIIEMVIGALAMVCDEVIIVAKKPDLFKKFDVRIVKEKEKEFCSLIGLYNGLKAANSEYSFVAACDMPFLNVKLIEFMKKNAQNNDIYVPFVKERYQPLYAIYHKRCLEHIEEKLKKKEFKFTSFYKSVKVEIVNDDQIRNFDPNLQSFLNVNSVDDYNVAIEHLK